MASITKINGKRGVSYKITVSNGYDATGKKLRATTTYRPNPTQTLRQQKKALEKFVYEFEQKVKNGCSIEGDKITLREFTQQWLEEYASHQLELTTISSYNNYIKKHILPALGHYKLSEIKPLHLQSFYNSLLRDGIRSDGKSGGYSPATVRKYHAILSSILSAAFKWQLIESNPCMRVKPPKLATGAKVKCFTLEQAEFFLNILNSNPNIPEQLRVFFYMALYGGFRRGELIALTWDKVDFDKNMIIVDSATGYTGSSTYNKAPKTKGSVRNVILPAAVMNMLSEYKCRQDIQIRLLGEQWKGGSYLFTQHNGKQMYISTPSHAFKKIIDVYNQSVPEGKRLPQIGLHGLRHTHATLLICANTDIKTVSARLGHSQASTTLNIYAHSLKKADAACADTMDNLLHITAT